MNKVIEEALTNMIRRIEKLENNINNISMPTNYSTIASKAQTNYLRSLGGKVWDGMSKEEAGKGIDNCLLGKKTVEPVGVDTEDIGLDEEGLL